MPRPYKEESNEKKVFVSSIPKFAKEADLYAHFSKYGDIVSIVPFFTIGKGNNTCTVIEYLERESRDTVLDGTHYLFDRYLDCKEYLRGDKLKKRNMDMKKKNIYLKNIGSKLSLQDLKDFFKSVGDFHRIKVGYSIKGDCRYAIVYFKEEQSAEKSLEQGYFTIKGKKVEVTRYRERIHIDIKVLGVENKKGPQGPEVSQKSLESKKPKKRRRKKKDKKDRQERQEKNANKQQAKKSQDKDNGQKKDHQKPNGSPNEPQQNLGAYQQPQILNQIRLSAPVQSTLNTLGQHTQPPVQPIPKVGTPLENGNTNPQVQELFRKNDDNSLFEVRLISYLHLRFSHSSYNLRYNWGFSKGRRPKRVLDWFEPKDTREGD